MIDQGPRRALSVGPERAQSQRRFDTHGVAWLAAPAGGLVPWQRRGVFFDFLVDFPLARRIIVPVQVLAVWMPFDSGGRMAAN
jgi:hypothetical protein